MVLDVPHLEARVKLKTLIAGSFSIHDLRVAQASWRFAQMSKEQSIGFLAALAPKTPPPPQPASAATAKNGPGSFFQIVNAELGDLNAVFDFPGVWGLELRHIHATASLIESAVDPAHPSSASTPARWSPKAAAGCASWMTTCCRSTAWRSRASRPRRSTPTTSSSILEAAETGHSRLVAKGFFTGIYGATSEPGIDLHGHIDDAGDALGAVAAGKKIDGLTVGGHGASVKLDFTQSFAKLKVAGAFRGLDVGFNEYRAQQIGFDFRLRRRRGAGRPQTLPIRGAGRRALQPGRAAAHRHTQAAARSAPARLAHRQLPAAGAARDGRRPTCGPHRRAR